MADVSIYPPSVQEYIERVVAQTGEVPEVIKVTRGWTLIANNGRVRNEAFFKVSPSGRTFLKNVKLSVDGKQRPTVWLDDDFGKLWRDPTYRQSLPRDFPTGANIEDAPKLIQKAYEHLSAGFGESLEVGHERGYWALSLFTDSVELIYALRDGKLAILLVLDGVDYTHIVENNVEKMMDLLSGRFPSETQTQSSSVKADSRAQRGRTNSVEVRNTVVIRT
ncbi:MAG: hypothetical protein WC054_00910 [Candidatus Nanopelagicales bacterium]